MLIEEISKDITNKAENIRSVSEVKEVIKDILNHTLAVEKELNKILMNLTSENVREIDFGRTRYKNYKKTILRNYADKDYCERTYVKKE